jgi:hypothetical protein
MKFIGRLKDESKIVRLLERTTRNMQQMSFDAANHHNIGARYNNVIVTGNGGVPPSIVTNKDVRS